MARSSRPVGPAWGQPWPPLGERVSAALEDHPLLTVLMWSSDPGRGADPLALFQRVVSNGLWLLLPSFDHVTSQVLASAAAVERLDRDRLLAEAAGVAEDAIDLRVRHLHTMGLVVIDDNAIALAPAAVGRIPLPLPSFLASLDALTSDRLDVACRQLGVFGGTRKAERAAAVSSVLCDPELLTRAVASCGREAAAVFTRVAERSWAARFSMEEDLPGAVAVWDLGLPPNQVISSRSSIGSSGVGRSALDLLSDRCLLGRDGWNGSAWMWLETHVALTGSLFDSWKVPVDPPTRTIDEPAGVAFRALAQAELLIERISSDAPEGKKSGDRRPPVKAVKASAAAAGVDHRLASIVVDAAIDMGLLMAVDLPVRGRGRTSERPVAWVANPARVREWRAQLPEARWLGIVASWITGSDSPKTTETLTLVRRMTLVGRLAALPDGHGVAMSDLPAWMASRHPNCAEGIDDVVADLVRLGAVSGGVTIGLGAVGRAMLAEHIASVALPVALGDSFGSGETSFVVQPDHTIMASADLAPELVATLAQIAEVESEGGAVVWRLTPNRLAAAASTLDASQVVQFLHDGSSVPVAENVIRFVQDHLVAPRPVTIGAAASHLVVDDPMLLSQALAVKAAKLTLLAPGVAVSPLTPAKLREALVTKGVAVDLDASTGVPKHGSNGHEPVPSWQVSQRAADDALRSPMPVPLGAAVVASVAGHMDRGVRS